jgi:2'-hydroxyisoflavone reductase
MRLLILGGTGFLGRHLVEAAGARGHELTLFDRGRTAPELFPELERLRGDREGDLDALRGRVWDAVVDASGYTPQAVERSADTLRGRADHYAFVSSVSAYADLSRPGIDESATLAANGTDYGAAKAAAERVLERAWASPLLRARPGVLVGPHDRSGRFGYWVRRVAAGGDLLVPGPPDRHVQVLDASDLASWLVAAAEARTEGVFNAVGPDEPLTMEELLAACRRVTASDARPVWVDPEFLVTQGLRPWSDVPLWPAGAFAGIHEIDGSRAVRAGLRFRPLEETIADVHAWETAHSRVARPRGPTREREAELLEAWRRSSR